MAIVQAGRPVSSGDIKNTSGQLATQLRNIIQQSDSFRIQMESWPDADLLALGLTQEEINAQKGFFVGDLVAIRDAFKNSVWVKQLLGTGV